MAVGIVLAFALLNLSGISRVAKVAKVIAAGAASLALLSAVLPLIHGDVSGSQATSWHLLSPFRGVFGELSSAMAGLYLIGFAAPAFEAATCHVGEMRNPARALPRAVLASAVMAGLFFLVLPAVWLGVFGDGLGLADGAGLANLLGPTFSPLFGGLAKSAAIWFLVLNMFHGTVQPLAGASRTLSQLSEDGLLPRLVGRRNRHDAPHVAIALTAGMAIVFLVAGDPIWMIAAANFTYLISIALPSVAVWLLRRDAPEHPRLWRAPKGTVGLGLLAAMAWLVATMLGFRQFGLPVVLSGLALAYSGSLFYLWRRFSDLRGAERRGMAHSLHTKLTGAMLAVMVLDGAGYLLAVTSSGHDSPTRVAVLEDIFVAVALVSIGVGLVLPGMISHSVTQVATAAKELSSGTLAELTRAMDALGRGELDQARANPQVTPVVVRSRDEVGAMAVAFNEMQNEVSRAARALDRAREALSRSRGDLEYLATHDSLTTLPNRRHVKDEVDRLVSGCVVAERPCAVVVLDLDGFKYINDSRGHAVGDDVLTHVADLFRAQLRPVDFIGRVGGDEFVAVLLDIEADEAQLVIFRLLEALRCEAILVTHGRAVRVTASAGIAFLDPAVPQCSADLLVEADVAMYQAKDSGRDRLALYSAGDVRQADLRGRHTSVERIQEALEQDRFVLHAQPILDLSTGRVDRYEVLLRMIGADGTIVMPGDFLPTAERSGLIGQIDQWVITEVCRMLGEQQRAGSGVHLSVNLSGTSMGEPTVLALIERELGRLPRRGGLTIEVTETAAIVDIDRARAFAEHLESLGCEFALDDFGAGYGSFYYLKHLPFDYLKIDGGFIRDLVVDRADQVVVRSLVQIARELGKHTVAEFVEDKATLDKLRELGVDYAQGYHIGRPGPLDSSPALRSGRARRAQSRVAIGR
jgi:diguanylate cyclase (GGDEF)-like protein